MLKMIKHKKGRRQKRIKNKLNPNLRKVKNDFWKRNVPILNFQINFKRSP